LHIERESLERNIVGRTEKGVERDGKGKRGRAKGRENLEYISPSFQILWLRPWIKMSLAMNIGLGSGDVVLDMFRVIRNGTVF